MKSAFDPLAASPYTVYKQIERSAPAGISVRFVFGGNASADRAANAPDPLTQGFLYAKANIRRHEEPTVRGAGTQFDPYPGSDGKTHRIKRARPEGGMTFIPAFSACVSRKNKQRRNL